VEGHFGAVVGGDHRRHIARGIGREVELELLLGVGAAVATGRRVNAYNYE
jgi:hypothetical protein